MPRRAARPLVIIPHPPLPAGAGRLVRELTDVRIALAGSHAETFAAAGGEPFLPAVTRDDTFGSWVADFVQGRRGGVVLVGFGAVPLLRPRDARALVRVARSRERVALTNNRFSSDVCAVGDMRVLRDLPPLTADNGLPRWLEANRGVRVRELGARRRLGIDLDTPLDLALLRDVAALPGSARHGVDHRYWVDRLGLDVPRRAEIRRVLADPTAELLVAGRTSGRTIRWLERHAACRVRAWVEERGMRAASATERPDGGTRPSRPPASILARLLEHEEPEALGAIVAHCADGAVIDTRVLLAARLGRDERAWPSAEDRFASDLLRADRVRDPWLAALTRSAAAAEVPILLGAHTLVGPGLPLLAPSADRPRWARGHPVAR
ncbi:MAG: hypothetical protein KF809_00420 [Chloroflexi bacterium]|nr:hypothetical protein [Chloroflexota bacterium]